MPRKPVCPEQAERLARQEKLKERLADWLTEDPEGTVIAMSDLMVATVAAMHPEPLTAAAKSKILDNYPQATEALMQERSMNREGLMLNTVLAMQSLQIGLDYSPVSHWALDSALDAALPKSVGARIGQQVADAFDLGAAEGMSLFGVAATLILTATVTAQSKGLVWPKLIRPLMDAINIAMDTTAPTLSKAQEEEIMQNIMNQMGVSRVEAKRYMEAAKRQRAS